MNRFLLIIIIFNITHITSAWSFNIIDQPDQEITVNVNNISLRQALDEVAKQSKRSITYNNEDVETGIRITCNKEKIGVKAILDFILKDTGLGYRELNHIIVIYKLPAPVKQEKKGSLEGTLMSTENNDPLIGATVRIVGTNLGTITDVTGNYVIRNITPPILTKSLYPTSDLKLQLFVM